MVRLHIITDLHLLRQKFEMPQTRADVLICAGDMDEGLRGMAWLLQHVPDRPVLYVPGNHEYYGQSLTDFARQLEVCAQGSKITVLQQRTVTGGGVRFLGCTLWTDFLLGGDPEASMLEASAQINDYKRIHLNSSSERPVRPLDIVRRHVIERSWLAAELARPHPGPTVVVTHHAPSRQSLPKSLANHPRGPSFASDLTELIEKMQPDLWIHGHVHHFTRYRIGKTEVICNPRGYASGSDTGFVPNLVVEL